jgi:precorrin-6B methylase 2
MRFDDPVFAKFYDQEQSKSGYPGKLLDPVLAELENYPSVIDIGAGSGFFTIPLLQRGHNVTAIEPSKAMTEILLNKASDLQSPKLSIINDRWENCSYINKHDAAICIHSLYPMDDIKKSILLMKNSASKKIIIVRNSARMKTLSGLIRKELAPEEDRDLNMEITVILKSAEARYDIKEIQERRLHKFRSIDEETKQILFQLKLPEGEIERVKELISSLTFYDGNFFVFESFFCDNMYIFF